MTKINHKINHVVILVDESDSMYDYTDAVVQVMDDLMKVLAEESVTYTQETRVSIYTYSSAPYRASKQAADCIVFDMGIDGRTEQMPSLRGRYTPRGMTALIDATWLAIDDLEKTAQMYGEHSFVIHNVTDGVNNASRHTPAELSRRMERLPDNWTMSALVPNDRGVQKALEMGYPGGNITKWDATSTEGVTRLGDTLRASTVSLMQTRNTTGARGTKTLFQADMTKVDETALKKAGIKPLDPSKYVLVPITEEIRIDEFVKKCRPGYEVGKSFYQLTGGRTPKGKRGILVQGNKAIAVLNKHTNELFTGPEARRLIGLDNMNTTIDPRSTKGDYLLFVQSTSLNRVLGYGLDENGKVYPNRLLMML